MKWTITMNTTIQDSLLLNGILQAAVDPIIVSDAAGKILRANPAAYETFGYDADELMGQSVNVLMPEAFAAAHDGYMSHHIQTGEKRIIGIGREVEGMRKTGEVFPIHLSVGHAEVDNKRLFIGIIHDLSAQKATQDALARSQRLDAIGQMTGGISHDFNNLLTVIVGNLELLEMRGINEDQIPLVRDALEVAELGADLTARLMIFARKGSLKPIMADLRELTEDTLEILKRTLGSNYRIKTKFAPDLHQVMIDPVQLQSALINLALNARDAMDAGGELLVSISNVTIDDTYMAQETDMEPGEFVRLSISDNGAGMSLEAQKRAFEPFFSTKSNKGGTGLGLAMVYGFVRQSGGHITLYSEVDHGTSFGLYFPALNVANTRSLATDETEKATKLALGNGQTILVVEDNPKVRKLSIERLQDLGFQTLEAANGDAAYQMLEAGKTADILFSDLVMPGELNGYDLAQKVASDFPQIKILLTSGYASDVVTNTMAHDRLYHILHKPYRQSELALRLQALMDEPTKD
jgi:PAS domain S-box-containing protein